MSASGQRDSRKPVGASAGVRAPGRARRSTAAAHNSGAPRLPTGGIFMNMSQGDLFGGDVSVSVDSDDSEGGAPVVQEDFEAMALMSLSDGPGSY